jgi:group I intron endonuclease
MLIALDRKWKTQNSTISNVYVDGKRKKKKPTSGDLIVIGDYPERVSGIYKITSPSGRVYVGQAVDLRNRCVRYGILSTTEGMRKLYNSFCKYGISLHSFEVLEKCNKTELDGRERFYIELLNAASRSGLNCRSGGRENSSISEEGRIALSKKMKRYWESNKDQRSGVNHYLFGKPMPESHRKALSESRIKKKSALGGNNPKAKIVLHDLTGIYYDCLKDACGVFGLNYSNARSRLQGKLPNDTNLNYV